MTWLAGFFRSKGTRNPAFDKLVKELVKIGRATYRHRTWVEGGPGAFWLPGEVKNPRVVGIGEELYRLGSSRPGKTQVHDGVLIYEEGIVEMLQARARVYRALGSGPANDLSYHWDGIGGWTP